MVGHVLDHLGNQDSAVTFVLEREIRCWADDVCAGFAGLHDITSEMGTHTPSKGLFERFIATADIQHSSARMPSRLLQVGEQAAVMEEPSVGGVDVKTA
jgi:hypothetical protein